MDDFRYDLVWRRIHRDAYAKKLEGRFQKRFERLAHLVNWGALSWLHRHAIATKQSHHLGTEHNASRFLSAQVDRTRHRPALRTAAHILHWGHPPLSYQSAEALLRAAHVEPTVKRVLEQVVSEVITFGSLNCLEDDHEGRCAEAILNGERPFELYRWLSAWIASEEWPRLWSAIQEAESTYGGTLPDEDETKRTIVRTLVCHDDPGYKVLTACNQADYVPRDLLQCGTAWLSLDPDVLWESDPIGRDAADEWALIESSRTYLQQRFYTTPTAKLLHTLAARIVANDLVRRPFDIDTLRELLETDEGDVYYDSELRPYHRERFLLLKSTAYNQLESDWWELGTFKEVSVPTGSRLDAEDFLTERSGRNRLSYPISEGHSVYAELPSQQEVAGLAGDDRQYATVQCHHRRISKEPKARPLLNVLANIDDWIQPGRAHEVGNALISWLLKERIRQQTSALARVGSDIIADNSSVFAGAVSDLRKRSSFIELNSHDEAAFQAELVADTEFGHFVSGAGEFFLRLPARAARLAAGRTILEFFRKDALRRAGEGRDGGRGAALELAVAADQLLASDESSHRFLVLNATQWDDRRMPVREWDVIRIDLLPGGQWGVVAIECAVTRDEKKDEDARLLFDVLQQALRGRGAYGDFSRYETLLATVDGGELVYDDAGRSYTRPT